MTQTEKTEALKELRLWLLDGHLRLTVDDIALLKKRICTYLRKQRSRTRSCRQHND